MNTRERSEAIFAVASYETDVFGKMSLFALFNWFQDLAGVHAVYRNVGYKQYTEEIFGRFRIR